MRKTHTARLIKGSWRTWPRSYVPLQFIGLLLT